VRGTERIVPEFARKMILASCLGAGVADVVASLLHCSFGFGARIGVGLEQVDGTIEAHRFSARRAGARIRNGLRFRSRDVPFQAEEVDVQLVTGAQDADTLRQLPKRGTDFLEFRRSGQDSLDAKLSCQLVFEIPVRGQLIVRRTRPALEQFHRTISGRIVPARSISR
jgi:hypothetical protein